MGFILVQNLGFYKMTEQLMHTAYQLPTPSSSIGDLDQYIRYVNGIDMLSESEETSLAEQLQQHHNLDAAQRLILSHLRFVVKIARGYQGYGLPQSDLIQEGNIGLMKAVRRFNPQVGVRLVSYAVHWIKAEMHDYIIKNWRIVKVATTKAQRKLFFNLRSCKKRLGWMGEQEIQEVASVLNVPVREVKEMENRMSSYDPSFEAPVEDTFEADFAPERHLTSNTPDPADLIEQHQSTHDHLNALHQAMDAMEPRMQSIIKARYLSEEKITLSALAKQMGVSIERIRQIEKAALLQLKKALGPAIANALAA